MTLTGPAATGLTIARVDALLASYDLQGEHRTGGPGDQRCAEWLVEELAGLGITARLEPVPAPSVEVERATVTVGGRVLRGTPQPHPGLESTVVEGTLGPAGGSADIGVLEAPQALSGAAIAAARQAGHRAVLVVTPTAIGGTVLHNVEPYPPRGDVPVLQLPGGVGEALWATRRARVDLQVRDVTLQAANVVADLPGDPDGPDRPPTTVLTPRSAWWTSTAERAGGIVGWLVAAARLRATPDRGPVRLLATTGHELDHLGLRHHLDRHPPTGGWLHLGANLGATGTAHLAFGSDDRWRDAGRRALQRALPETTAITPDTPPPGEARELRDHDGVWFVSLIGTNPWFHLPSDRHPTSTDAEAVAALADAVADLAVHMATSP